MKSMTRISLGVMILFTAALLLSGGCKDKKLIAVSMRTGAPAQVMNITPPDGATNLETTNQTIRWSNTEGAESFNIYLGSTYPGTLVGNTTDTSYDTGALNAGTQYYWRIDAVNADGEAVGVVWSFTTGNAPAIASNPNPADGATNIDNSSTLSWRSSAGASEYVVYFGTSSPPALAGCASTAQYDPGSLTDSTPYYWRVDAVNQFDTTQGDEWTFMTAGLPGNASNPTPADNATDVSTHPDLSWTAATLAADYRVYMDTFSPPTSDRGLTDDGETTYSPGWLQRNTTYYWRIQAENLTGTSLGPIWSFGTGPGPIAIDWAQNAGAVNNDTITSVASLPDGTTVMAGYFYGCATFAAGTPQATTVYTFDCANHDEIFVAKFANDGTLQWVVTAGDINGDYADAIDIFADGSCAITGGFYATCILGRGEANETTLTAAGGGSDIFVAHYASNGDLNWARQAYGFQGWDDGYNIAALGDGTTLVAGYYFGCNVFNYGELDNVNMAPTPTGCSSIVQEAAFVAKYDTDGDLLWISDAFNSDCAASWFTESSGIAANPDGSFYLTGYYHELTTFGLGEANETSLQVVNPLNGEAYGFIARYNSDGTLDWARDIRCPNYYYSDGVGVDVCPDGGAIISGYFSDFVFFNFGEIGQVTLYEPDGSDQMYFARYNPDGSMAWAKQLGGSNDDYGYAVAVDTDGTFYLQCDLDSSSEGTIFGEGEDTEIIFNTGTNSMYVAHYNGDGTFISARLIADNLGFWHNHVSLSMDSIFVTGNFSGSITLGTGEPNETTLNSAGNNDIFIAKFKK
ncbi:MAG: fibronectin type III domain-containing protein [Planctomycetota bacterium]|jgi:hypothetical protein